MKSVQKLIAELDVEMAPYAQTYGAGAVPAATASHGGAEALSDEQECYNFINGGVSVMVFVCCWCCARRTFVLRGALMVGCALTCFCVCPRNRSAAPFGSRSIQHGSESLPEESLESGRVVRLPF